MKGSAVNEILYCLIFADPADEATVARLADLINSGKVLVSGAPAYRDDIDAVLADPAPVEDRHATGHSDADLRTFLNALRERI